MEKEINLKKLFSVIKRRLWIIIVLTIITTVAGAVYSILLKTPLYAYSARIIIQANNAEMMNTLKVMINEPAVLEKVAAELHTDRSASALSGQISTESVQGSQVVKINVVDADPEFAAKIANTTATVYKQEVSTLLNFNNVSVLSEAKASKYPVPININHSNTIRLFFFIGIILSIGFVFLLDSLDDTIKSERSMEELLGIPTLGGISKMNKRNIVDKYSKGRSVALRGNGNWITQIEEKQTKLRKKA
ncbi:YveK family protein [Bacillus sp. 123MFChir2]|uniref:YveK family protein n=1 Tax=Bacillus sp. 123MFChir2 TaxID=1169144 RepID=UPI00036D39DB|nr:Wzz/FepE/Etk N-terminal domain-containing protein [Bacillus sp. 123MFChir2]